MAMEDREDSAAWPFITYVFGDVKLMAADFEKKKAKKSVHRRSQESKKRTRKHMLESLLKPGIRLTAHVL